MTRGFGAGESAAVDDLNRHVQQRCKPQRQGQIPLAIFGPLARICRSLHLCHFSLVRGSGLYTWKPFGHVAAVFVLFSPCDSLVSFLLFSCCTGLVL